MSRVFEAMRRKSPSGAEQAPTPHDVLEAFPLREVTVPATRPDDMRSPAPVATGQRPVQVDGDGRAIELQDAAETKTKPETKIHNEKATMSFLELIRAIARDEAEQRS